MFGLREGETGVPSSLFVLETDSADEFVEEGAEREKSVTSSFL